MAIGRIWLNIQFVDNMKNQKFSKTVKEWFNNFKFCYGNPTVNDEAESFYNAGFDDGVGHLCKAMKDHGIPVDTILKIYDTIDPECESITYETIHEDWPYDEVESVVPKQQVGR